MQEDSKVFHVGSVAPKGWIAHQLSEQLSDKLVRISPPLFFYLQNEKWQWIIIYRFDIVRNSDADKGSKVDYQQLRSKRSPTGISDDHSLDHKLPLLQSLGTVSITQWCFTNILNE